MPNLDDIRSEDLRDREIDREIDIEKSDERVKEAVAAAIREAGLKEDSKDVVIATNIMERIERDDAKPDDFKQLQQGFAAELFGKEDRESGLFSRDIENKSAELAFVSVMGDSRNDDERMSAQLTIRDILNDERGLSDSEKTAACFGVIDILEKGGFEKTAGVNIDEQRAEIIERAVRENPVSREQTRENTNERGLAERAEVKKDLTNDLLKDSVLLDYRIEKIVERVEDSPFYNDQFRDMQERFLAAELRDTAVISSLQNTKEPEMVMRDIIDGCTRDAFQETLMDFRSQGKISNELAQDIYERLNDPKEFGDARERDAAMANAMNMINDGRMLPSKDNLSREETFKEIKNGGKELLEADREPAAKDSRADEVIKGLQMDERTEKTIRDAVTINILENRLYADDMKSDVAGRTAELLKNADLKTANIRGIVDSAERQAVLDRITDGKDTLTRSQERAVSYIEKLDARKDLDPKDKTANRMAVLDAYTKGLIPDRDDLSRRTERSVEHNISMDAKDRISAARESERLDRAQEDEGRYYQDKLGIKLDPHNSEALNAGLAKLERSEIDASLKDEYKEKFAQALAAHDKSIGDAAGNDIRDMLAGAVRDVAVDKITNGTGSVDTLEKENAVAVIDSIMRKNTDLEINAAATQKAVEIYERGQLPKDGKAEENSIEDYASRAIRMGRQELEKDAGRPEEKRDSRQAPEKEPQKDPARDDARNDARGEKKEREERPIGVDPEKDAKEEARNSKKTWLQEAKEVWDKANEIYDRKVIKATHNTDTTLSQSERDIVERGIKLRQEQIDKNNAEKASIVEKNIQLTKEGKEIPKETVERLGKLERFNRASEREIYKMKEMVDPDYIRARALSRPACESREHLKKELEAKTVYPDPSDKRLFHFREEALHWRHHPGIMERVTYESCLYAGLTGRHPSSVAGKDISTFEVRNNSLPAMCFSRAMEACRHSEGARMYLEIFKVDGRKAKPLEINNVCAVLDKINKSNADERLKTLQRSVLADLCRDGKIGNTKANDAYRENLFQKTLSGAKERMAVKDPVKEGLEREYRKDDLRKELTKVPEKTDREIVKYVLNSKEKVDLQALLEISRDAKESLREANGGKPVAMEPYQLSKQELRQIICGANPDALSTLYPINMKLPEGATLNIGMYERAVSVMRGTNEQNEIVKMAMVNFALSPDGSFRGLDGEEGLRMESIEKNATLLVKSLADMSAKHELVKVIRQDLRDTVKAEREALKETARSEQRVINYDRQPDKILRDASRSIGNLCRSEDYSREKMEEKIREIRDGMKYHRNTYLEDFKMIKTRDRGLNPNDAIAVAKADPRMFLPIQRAGISIGKNGLINEARLNDTIMKMESIPKDEIVVRMAVLEKNFIDHKNNGMDLNNAINMGNRNDTRDTNNLALWMYARDNGLKFRQPVDEREKEALVRNIETLERCEKTSAFEREFVSGLVSSFDAGRLEMDRTFTNINEDMRPVAAIATMPDYQERLTSLIDGLKARSDANSGDVKDSVRILEMLSRLSTNERADTMEKNSCFNRSYDENGLVDVDLEARFVAIRTVERIFGIEHSAVGEDYFKQVAGSNFADAAKDDAAKIDEKAKRLYHGFSQKMPSAAEIDVAKEYMRNNGYDSKLQINQADSPITDGKAEFLVKMGYGKEICASKGGEDDNRVRYMYMPKNLEKIETMYQDLKAKADCIRDNFSPDGKASVLLQRQHLQSIDGIDRDMAKAAREYQYVRDHYSVPKDKIPGLMIEVTSRDGVAIRETGLRGMPMYKGAENIVSMGRGQFEDRMMFLKNTAFYPNPIDKVRGSIQIEPYFISSDDARTIMDNREKIVDCGVQYSLDFSKGYGYPMLSVAGLNDISVSALPDDLYRAIARSCPAEDFKAISEMRHDEKFYARASAAATAYQKYSADYSRNISKRPDNYGKHVDDFYNNLNLIYDTRNEIASMKDVDELEKTAVYAAIEYSRQQLFAMVPDDVYRDAMGRWTQEHQLSYLTLEHQSKVHYDEVTAGDYEEDYRDTPPFEMAKELSERIGYALDDLMGFMDAYDKGLMTEEEYNRASLHYNFFGDEIDREEYLREHANDEDEYAPYASDDEDSRYDDREPLPSADGEFVPEPEPDGDYYGQYQREEDSTVYSDEPMGNTPFASLFDGLNLEFERDNPVVSEDELGVEMFHEDAAFYEEMDDDERYNKLTPEDIELIKQTERMNEGIFEN